MDAIQLTKQQRLSALHPERRARVSKESGKLVVYVCEDRGSGTLVLTPKLAALAEYLSSKAGPLRQDKITLSSLYNILRVKDGEGRTGGWSKHRYRCRAVPIGSAALAFEQLRATGEYDQAVVLGSTRCAVLQAG